MPRSTRERWFKIIVTDTQPILFLNICNYIVKYIHIIMIMIVIIIMMMMMMMIKMITVVVVMGIYWASSRTSLFLCWSLLQASMIIKLCFSWFCLLIINYFLYNKAFCIIEHLAIFPFHHSIFCRIELRLSYFWPCLLCKSSSSFGH